MKVDSKSDKLIISIPIHSTICCSKDRKLVKSTALYITKKILIIAILSTTDRLISGC